MTHPISAPLAPCPPFAPNTEAFERGVLLDPLGFREYDARWLYPTQINLNGMMRVGAALGAMVRDRCATPDIVVGHDYRSYSAAVKHALIIGLMSAGCRVQDIGLCLTPTAYFAQFHLDIAAVAMVTASHNENGWTGVKMGIGRPITFGPVEMRELKNAALSEADFSCAGGAYTCVPDMKARYLDDLCAGQVLSRKLRAVVACGNGTAAAFAPEMFARLGVDVVPMDCDLDYTFPNYNPNPEDLKMVHALGARVRAMGADVGLAFDGDGDRVGVVDSAGNEVAADKLGVLLARFLSATHAHAKYVVDVKSTGLYAVDPVLRAAGAQTQYWLTGNSYIKRRMNETGALAAFEKSGHFFFGPGLGRGYDDGLLSARYVVEMLAATGKSLSELAATLPHTWMSPTMQPSCPDDQKYDVVRAITERIQNMQAAGEMILGQAIRDVNTINGVRVTLSDGTWGLLRASSNKPALVVVVESPVSEIQMRRMFGFIDDILLGYAQVGVYDQKIDRAA